MNRIQLSFAAVAALALTAFGAADHPLRHEIRYECHPYATRIEVSDVFVSASGGRSHVLPLRLRMATGHRYIFGRTSAFVVDPSMTSLSISLRHVVTAPPVDGAARDLVRILMGDYIERGARLPSSRLTVELLDATTPDPDPTRYPVLSRLHWTDWRMTSADQSDTPHDQQTLAVDLAAYRNRRVVVLVNTDASGFIAPRHLADTAWFVSQPVGVSRPALDEVLR